MAKLNWVVFCERAVIDSATNSLSIMNIYEELHPTPPTKEQIEAARGTTIGAALPAALVTHWERSHASRAERATQIRLRLVAPNGSKQIEATQHLDFGSAKYARLVANLLGLPIGQEGTYLWRVHIRSGSTWKLMGQISYDLIYMNSPIELKRLIKTARARAFKSG